MSAEVLREAASEIRRDTFNGQTEDAEFMEAVADWLEESASDLDGQQRSVDGLLSGIGAEGTVQIDAEHLAPAALAVARAYLGSDS